MTSKEDYSMSGSIVTLSRIFVRKARNFAKIQLERLKINLTESERLPVSGI